MNREGSLVTHTYDDDGNLTKVSGRLHTVNPGVVTMSYDYEDRLVKHELGNTVTTYTYSGDGLKRSEQDATGITTLIWDGSEVLQERD